ncbi:type II secretion system protein GspG [Pseudomonas sp. CGJS7]|uniref:type II secretion system protein GspG n=1 Tax=Pseudomonas sp. CGJS7 TaxID=3109348 RepID=UPI0030083775
MDSPTKRSRWIRRAAIAGAMAVAIAFALGWLLPRFFGGCDYPNRPAMTRAIISILGSKVEAFRQDNGRLPASLEELTHPSRFGPYANANELVDGWERPFYYRVEPDGRQFIVFSLGKDGRLGGEGDAGDLQSEAIANAVAGVAKIPTGR